jgi:predicted permease
MLATLFSIIAPVFISAAIGFFWARSGRAFDPELITTLVTLVGTPCLVFSALVEVDLEPGAVQAMAAAATVVTVAFAAVGAAVLRVTGLSVRTFLNSIIFTNCGNMGLPLCLLAFGEQGLALGITFFTVSAVGLFTGGVAISAGTMSLKDLARMPMIYAVLAAVAFMAAGAKPPDWLANTTRILGGMTIPLMLITLGISLAKLRVAGLGRSVLVAVVRLTIGFGIGVAVAALFGMEGMERGVLILESAMPAAVFNYLFAQRYGTAPEEVAGVIMVSTLLSFLTLPALVWFVL